MSGSTYIIISTYKIISQFYIQNSPPQFLPSAALDTIEAPTKLPQLVSSAHLRHGETKVVATSIVNGTRISGAVCSS